jgi:hypothetical protein
MRQTAAMDGDRSVGLESNDLNATSLLFFSPVGHVKAGKRQCWRGMDVNLGVSRAVITTRSEGSATLAVPWSSSTRYFLMIRSNHRMACKRHNEHGTAQACDGSECSVEVVRDDLSVRLKNR